MDILKKYGINPYEYLGIDRFSDIISIKAAYKAKALLLHPDKTNGKTEAQFKILVLCYKYAVNNNINTPIASQEELRAEKEELEEVSNGMNIYNTNFEDKETRSKLFAFDDIDFEKFEKQMKRTQGLSTNYDNINYYKDDIINKLKCKGKFDKEKFNAFFTKLKKQGKVGTDLVKVERVLAANENAQYVKVNIHDGLVINSIDKKDFSTQPLLSNKDMEKILKTNKEELKNLIKENKKDTGAVSKKKIKELVQKNKLNVVVDNKKSFSTLESEIDMLNVLKITREKEEQRKIVENNRNIYTRTLKSNFIS